MGDVRVAVVAAHHAVHVLEVILVGLRDRGVPRGGVLGREGQVAARRAEHHLGWRGRADRPTTPVVKPARRVGDAHVAHERGEPGNRVDRRPKDAAGRDTRAAAVPAAGGTWGSAACAPVEPRSGRVAAVAVLGVALDAPHVCHFHERSAFHQASIRAAVRRGCRGGVRVVVGREVRNFVVATGASRLRPVVFITPTPASFGKTRVLFAVEDGSVDPHLPGMRCGVHGPAPLRRALRA